MQNKNLVTEINSICEKAKIASRQLASLSTFEKNTILKAIADAIENEIDFILKENSADIEEAIKKSLPSPMIERLRLDKKKILSISKSVRNLIQLEDPVGKILSSVVRPNGLKIEKISVPIGVIAIIYESRPNVTVDSAALCLKAGNAVILRGGSEARKSNLALLHCINRAAIEAGLPEGAIQHIPQDRDAVKTLLKMDQHVNLVIPRGGEALIRTVAENSKIPVIKHYKGVCHLYIDKSADLDMAEKITLNAKCQRPGVCNAIETLLIHKDLAENFCPRIANALIKQGVELRGDCDFRKYCPSAKPATEEDWFAEYLDVILAVRIVPDIKTAIDHINFYGSQHSDAIVSNDTIAAEEFLNLVDSAAVYHNASTRFTDGGEFGMGAEIGISTDKIHARGPMGLQELNTYKYIVRGNGQCRT